MIFIGAILIYTIMAIAVFVGFLSYPSDTAIATTSQINVTIVIAARNEEATIEQCLQSILEQDYPIALSEIIIVDDASTDKTVELANAKLISSKVNYQFIKNATPLGKKKSIKLAIENSKSDFIVCRDADTFTISKNWLSTIVNYAARTKKEFIICPIAIDYKGGILSGLQEIETSILNLFAISSSYFKVPFLCNGANLAFTKKLFYETGAYKNHLSIPSGDDVLFLQEVVKTDVKKIGYLKNANAVVYTYPEKTFFSLLQQKLRWSGKVVHTKSLINWLSAATIAFSNGLWLWAIVIMAFALQNPVFALIFVLCKLLIDILLVFLAARFIRVKASLPMVLLIGCLYPIYATAVSVLAPVIKPKWKK